MPKASEASGKRIDKMFMIIDLKNVGMKIFMDKKVKKILDIATKVT